jgi:hypothetical protein
MDDNDQLERRHDERRQGERREGERRRNWDSTARDRLDELARQWERRRSTPASEKNPGG